MISKNCEECGKEFEAYPAQKYCCRSCKNKGSYKKEKQKKSNKICKNCGRGFYERHKNRVWYCSRECYNFVRRGGLSAEESNFQQLLKWYKQRSNKLDIDFFLDEDKFRSLTKSNCLYCGSPPLSNVDYINRGNGGYDYNGIDRINNDLGYTEENSVPCCKECNYMKRNMSYIKFMEHINKIYNFNKNQICRSL